MELSYKNSTEWKIKQELVDVVLEAGGKVFGGYIRDMILHDHYATKYYEMCKEEGLIQEEIQENYNNPDMFPTTRDRMIIPNDIDCYFSGTAQLAAFETALSSKKFKYHRVFHRMDASAYIPSLTIPPNTMSHIRYKVKNFDCITKTELKSALFAKLPTILRNYVKKDINDTIEVLMRKVATIPHVIIDVLVKTGEIEEQEPPFSKIDFECNGLVLDKSGVHVSKNLLSNPHGWSDGVFKLHSIINDIIQRTARVIKDNITHQYRVDKMKDKGWQIAYPPFRHFYRKNLVLDKQDICIICNEELGGIHYKMKCCNTRYHKNCLIDCARMGPAALVDTERCITCKRDIHYIESDIENLRIQDEE